jgi:hypothetical protein
MTNNAWPLVESVARLLDHNQRDAVLGDSLEAGDGPWQTLMGVLGFVFRRQVMLCRGWRPWLAAFGLALPTTYLLMIVSVSVTCTSERLMGLKVGMWAPTGHEGFALLLCHIFLLIAWSWTSGFALGSSSRPTLWPAILSCSLLCGFMVATFCLASVSRFSLLLFVVPTICGVRQGAQGLRIRLAPAFILATAITVLMISAWNSEALWVFNWLLICPAWYLVATAQRPDSDWNCSGNSMQRPLRT